MQGGDVDVQSTGKKLKDNGSGGYLKLSNGDMRVALSADVSCSFLARLDAGTVFCGNEEKKVLDVLVSALETRTGTRWKTMNYKDDPKKVRRPRFGAKCLHAGLPRASGATSSRTRLKACEAKAFLQVVPKNEISFTNPKRLTTENEIFYELASSLFRHSGECPFAAPSRSVADEVVPLDVLAPEADGPALPQLPAVESGMSTILSFCNSARRQLSSVRLQLDVLESTVSAIQNMAIPPSNNAVAVGRPGPRLTAGRRNTGGVGNTALQRSSRMVADGPIPGVNVDIDRRTDSESVLGGVPALTSSQPALERLSVSSGDAGTATGSSGSIASKSDVVEVVELPQPKIDTPRVSSKRKANGVIRRAPLRNVRSHVSVPERGSGPVRNVNFVCEEIDTDDDAMVAAKLQQAEAQRMVRRRGEFALNFVMGPYAGPRKAFIGLTPLNDAEERTVSGLFTLKRNKIFGDELLCFLPSSNVSLARSHFQMLTKTEWVNDEIVDAFIGLLRARGELFEKDLDRTKGERTRPRVFFASCLCLNAVQQAMDGNDMPLLRLFSKGGLDLRYDGVAFVLNQRRIHWVALYFDIRERRVLLLDPLGSRNGFTTWQKAIARALGHYLGDLGEDVDVPNWQVVFNELAPFSLRSASNARRRLRAQSSARPRSGSDTGVPVPTQKDSGSCGIFALSYLECISRGVTTYFAQADIPLMRKRIALQLYNGVLHG